MELLIAIIIGVLISGGVFLILKVRTFPIVMGLTLISYAVNIFLFSMGRVKVNLPPIITQTSTAYTDPIPQALVLTAIVIGFGMSAFVIVLALRSLHELGNDHVDGKGIKQHLGDKK
ncbi:MAG: Na+/H+ antiporter subunit C [Sulfurospirillaceae bacterium]|jgi:multicomponent K+:H+ antiporter subunit C|nr:Na+/H+ antiporter subunit C [Sulfurospirillaceae bacterium]MCK9546288.1 Na+/H+ antiporter subunit C [Sulfurospirillaceae bacterium]MDY0237492.1 Na+/H+ antiporter subunit C [Campylobacterales bacterium]NLN00123.1 Na+/H+ antiporter subunit C [Campylobacteraceae bacterium]